jgi:hypothetical protein
LLTEIADREIAKKGGILSIVSAKFKKRGISQVRSIDVFSPSLQPPSSGISLIPPSIVTARASEGSFFTIGTAVSRYSCLVGVARMLPHVLKRAE